MSEVCPGLVRDVDWARGSEDRGGQIQRGKRDWNIFPSASSVVIGTRARVSTVSRILGVR